MGKFGLKEVYVHEIHGSMLNSFINMIKLLFQVVNVFVNINNQVIEPFELHKGVLQGCP